MRLLATTHQALSSTAFCQGSGIPGSRLYKRMKELRMRIEHGYGPEKENRRHMEAIHNYMGHDNSAKIRSINKY